jgi:hypothetical protein
MKQELTQILGLSSDATEEQITAAVRSNVAASAQNAAAAARDKMIHGLMQQSGGAMTREVALEHLKLTGKLSTAGEIIPEAKGH